mgnify:CR=1 FL=1
MEQEQQIKPDEPQVNKFAYSLAWLGFIISVGSIILAALKENKPPTKDDYRK